MGTSQVKTKQGENKLTSCKTIHQTHQEALRHELHLRSLKHGPPPNSVLARAEDPRVARPRVVYRFIGFHTGCCFFVLKMCWSDLNTNTNLRRSKSEEKTSDLCKENPSSGSEANSNVAITKLLGSIDSAWQSLGRMLDPKRPLWKHWRSEKKDSLKTATVLPFWWISDGFYHAVFVWYFLWFVWTFLQHSVDQMVF